MATIEDTIAYLDQELESHGIDVKDWKGAVLDRIEECDSVLAENGNYSRYKILSNTFVKQFFSEVVLEIYEEKLYLCGPFISQDEFAIATTLVTRFDLITHTWEEIRTINPPDPIVLFTRMPHHFVYHSYLFIGYPDKNLNQYCFKRLNLETFEWRDVQTKGEIPSACIFADACVYNHTFFHYGTANTSSLTTTLHALDLQTMEWQKLEFQGVAPTQPSKFFLEYDKNLLTFSQDGEFMYSLNLENRIWTKSKINQKLKDFQMQRNSHLMKVYGNEIILIRSVDTFQFNIFNIHKKEWRKKRIIGKGLHKVKTEPSYIIHENGLYLIGGQTARNHLLYLELEKPTSPPSLVSKFLNIKDITWISKMFQDQFCDAEIILEDGTRILVHRNIMVSRNDYFAKLFSGGFVESQKNQDRRIEVQIKGVSSKEFQVLIQFFYYKFDGLDDSQFDPIILFELAHQFLVEDLQLILIEYFIEHLNVDNCLMILAIFSSYGISTTKVIMFIDENRAQIPPTQFIEFCREYPFLVQEIFSSIPINKMKSWEESNTFEDFWIKSKRNIV